MSPKSPNFQPGDGVHENNRDSDVGGVVPAGVAGARPEIVEEQAFTQAGQALVPPPWGAVPFDYERVVQPVLDANCVRCHDTKSKAKLDLRGQRDAERIPVSYRTLIAGGWVDYFDWGYAARPFKAEPL